MTPVERDPGAEPRVWWLAAAEVDDLQALLDQQAAAPPPGGDRNANGGGNGDGGESTPASPAGPVVVGQGPARLGIVDPDDRKIRLARRMLSESKPWRGRGDVWFTPAGLARGPAGRADGDEGGKLVFLFPGVEPSFGAEATDLPALGERVGLTAPELRVDTLAHRSASIYRLGIFLDDVLARLGIRADLVAGHSIGEWSGTVAAGIVPHDRAGELLVDLNLDTVDMGLPDLEFAALTAGAAAVEDITAGIEGIVLSHDNSPNQSIICGPPAIVEDALARLRSAGILGFALDIRSGFHTPWMEASFDTFRAHMANVGIRPATVPMWSATTVGPYPDDPAAIVELHLRHLVEPVRFRPLVERLYHDGGARVFVQMGIGSLTAFVDATLGDLDHACVPLLTARRSAVAQLHRALTALWVEGVEVSPHALSGGLVDPDLDASATAPAPAMAAAPAKATASAPAHGPAPVPTTAPGMAAVTTPATTATSVSLATPTEPAPASLVAAAELLTMASQAGQDVLEALSARLTPALATAAAPAPGGAPTLAATAPAPAPWPSSPPPPPPPAAPPAVGPDRPPSSPPAGRRPMTWPTEKLVIQRRLSLESMPETLDHSLVDQPPGWPDPSDGFPIVAMTTQIQLLQDLVTEFAGGREVIEVFGVRNLRWLDLSTPQDVTITVVPKGDDVLSVALGGYCRANFRVGSYPQAPRYETLPLAQPRTTRLDAVELFESRVMFHGPRFQGITQLGPTGDDGILGDFVQLDTPGSLLDNLGKLVAYWVMDLRNFGESPLPIGVDRIELFGPNPEPGVQLLCDVRIVVLEPSLVKANGMIVRPDGTLWCRLEGWTSHVFHLDETMEPICHRTGDNYAAEPQAGGWNVVLERWPTGAGRDLTARRFLARAERAAYEAMNLLEQRRWLIDMIAAKDTVRRWLKEHHGIPSYPMEVTLEPDGKRRYRAVSPLIPDGHDLRLTLSSVPWLTVAVLGNGARRDIEAREIPDGTDPDTVAAEVSALVQARNPGAQVASVAPVTNIAPSSISVVVIPCFAVAWTV